MGGAHGSKVSSGSRTNVGDDGVVREGGKDQGVAVQFVSRAGNSGSDGRSDANSKSGTNSTVAES